MVRRTALSLVAFLLIASCTGAVPPPTSSPAPSPALSLPPTPAMQSAAAVVTASPTRTATPRPSVPQATPRTPTSGVTIVNESTSQFELWSPGGVRVFVDIVYPDRVTGAAATRDILLTTHLHDDHVAPAFVDAFPGLQLYNRSGTLTSADVRVVGLNAQHNDGDPMTDGKATDHIFVIDIGGIRVAVLGDLGQRSFTEGQLKALGHVDVAISQLVNPVSDASVSNGLVVAQMAQLKPQVLIPTHIGSLDEAKLAAQHWPAIADGSWVLVTKDRLPTSMTLLYMGDIAPAYQKIFKLPSCDWH